MTFDWTDQMEMISLVRFLAASTLLLSLGSRCTKSTSPRQSLSFPSIVVKIFREFNIRPSLSTVENLTTIRLCEN